MTTGLRERKKEATRQALADAALRLSCERGPDSVTVDQIAAAAGVSPRTFFNYFPSKEGALFTVPRSRVDEMLDALAQRPAEEPPLESLRIVLVGSTESFTEQAERWSRRLRLVREHPQLLAAYVASYGDIERALVAAVARRVGADPDRDLYPRLVVGVAVTAMRTAVSHWDQSGQSVSLDSLLDEAFARLGTGLALP